MACYLTCVDGLYAFTFSDVLIDLAYSMYNHYIYVSKKKGCLVATVKDLKAGMYTVEFTDGSVAKYSKSELKWRMSLANAMNNEAKSGAFPERVGRLRFLKIDPRGALFNRQDLAPG